MKTTSDFKDFASLLVTLYTYYTLKLYRITTLQLMGGITFQFQQSSD